MKLKSSFLLFFFLVSFYGQNDIIADVKTSNIALI